MNNNGFLDLSGARCRIMGLGRSNEALMKYLVGKGAEICVSDKRKSENEIRNVLQNIGIQNAEIIPYNEISISDYVFRTPAIRCDAPEITALTSKGAVLSSEAELFFKIAKGKMLGITGSDGKTTTTTLTFEILKEALGNERVYVGGNIGIPLISLADKLSDDSITVCELSSFQLMTFNSSPMRTAITNITENHLDYHRDIDEYVSSKSRIVGSLTQRLVISEKAYPFIENKLVKKPDEIIKTSFGSETDLCVNNGRISLFGEDVLNVHEIKVAGKHNVENYMTAIGLTYYEADKSNFLSVARSFRGVKHRNELVRVVNAVRYYNCSIDSTPSRTLATLYSHEGEDITLILGGYDKNLDFTEFSSVAPRLVNRFILLGHNKNKIEAALKNSSSFNKLIYTVADLKSAVELSAEISNCGSTVILSPASASFDMFKDFEQRGELFKNIVNSL